MISKINKTCWGVYQQINKEVNKGRGVLYDAISIILEDDKKEIQQICEFYNIDSQSKLDDDFKFAKYYLNSINETFMLTTNTINVNSNIKDISQPLNQLKDTLSEAESFNKLRNAIPYSEKISETFNKLKETIPLLDSLLDDDTKLYIVIVTACFLVGIPVCYKFLRNRRYRENTNIQNRQGLERQKPIAQTPPKIPVALCLVVPAYSVANLNVNSNIDKHKIKELIDESIYFLCPTIDQLNESSLNITQERPLQGSQQDFYIRIEIENGGKMKDQETTYGLKEGLNQLPYNNLNIIKRLGCLKRKTGLEKFNRI